MNYFKMREENWKRSFKRKLGLSKDIHKALEAFIGEYIYFSKNLKEIKSRSRRILGSVEQQIKMMPFTRKELDEKELEKIKLLLENTRKKLRQ